MANKTFRVIAIAGIAIVSLSTAYYFFSRPIAVEQTRSEQKNQQEQPRQLANTEATSSVQQDEIENLKKEVLNLKKQKSQLTPQLLSTTKEATNPATIFEIKSQCRALGEQREQKEDQEWRDGMNRYGELALYGYSPSLNTCIYGRTYRWYNLDQNMQRTTTEMSYHPMEIYDLMTGDLLYYQQPDLISDLGLLNATKEKFWRKYDSLIQ